MTRNTKASLKKSFDEDGFVLIPGFLDEEALKAVTEQLNDLIQHHLAEMPSNHVFYEDRNDPNTLKQLQDLQYCDSFFATLLAAGKFKEMAEDLLGEKVVGKTIEYFNKPSKTGKPTPPHQDNYYFMLNPPQALTMWLGLEDADEKNGCVRYIKGSHLKKIRPHGRTQTSGFSQAITDYGEKENREDEIFFRTKPGDLLVHHSMTIHRADGNSSENRTRKALGFIYFGESAKEDIERKRAYQQSLLADVVK
jgi:phytanoyl-CoA hydroxylase